MKIIFSRAILGGISALLFCIHARATEIYSVVLNDCAVHTGLIFDADVESVGLMNLQGTSLKIPRDQIKTLTIFNTVGNPFERIDMQGDARNRLREVSIDSQDQPYLTGWPVRFVEELVVFFDVTGKTYVLNFDRMTRVRKTVKDWPAHLLIQGNPISLEMSESLGSCPPRSPGPGALVRPTRIISDKIQLSEFITSFVTGFENMDSFEERTFLYALPYLYDRSTLMGFLSSGASFEQPKLGGFYFQWARGRPYRFQSAYKSGIFQMRNAPSAENFLGLETELKSHLFHASFTGNLSALAAGSSYYTHSLSFLERQASATERSHFAPGFNYIALMGVDYGQWSGSFGTYFPIFAFIADNSFREILSPRVQSIFRLMFTVPKFQARLLYSKGEVGKESGVNDRDISIDATTSVIGFVERFALSYDYVNADVRYKVTDELSASAQVIVVKGNYREVSPLLQTNSFDFDHTTWVASVRQQFGDYVSLTGTVRLYQQTQKFSFGGQIHDEPLSKTVFGGAFEFVF